MKIDEIKLIRFLIKVHKRQLIVFLALLTFLITVARFHYNIENIDSLDAMGSLIFFAFCLLSFIFSAYIGHIFKINSKGNFLSIHPFSKRSIYSTPHILFFLLSITLYFPLKNLWDGAHLIIGVSEILFLYTIPYIIFYSVKKIDFFIEALIFSIITIFGLMILWEEYLATWNIYQWNLITSICYIVITTAFILVVDKKILSTILASGIMLAFLGVQTLYVGIKKPKSLCEALAVIQHYPTQLAKNSFKNYMLSEGNWIDYKIDLASLTAHYHRLLFKFTRRYSTLYLSLEDKKEFLKIVLKNFEFIKRKYSYYYYSDLDFPISQNAIDPKERVFIARGKWKDPSIACQYIPLLPDKDIITLIFKDSECGRYIFSSSELQYLFHENPQDSFIKSIKEKLLQGNGKEDKKIMEGVSYLFKPLERTDLSKRGVSRKWNAGNDIREEDFARLSNLLFHDEKIFYDRFIQVSVEEKSQMIQNLDISNEDAMDKAYQYLTYICRKLPGNCRDFPRWEEKTNLFSIINDSFAYKRYSEKYNYYLLLKEITKNYGLQFEKVTRL